MYKVLSTENSLEKFRTAKQYTGATVFELNGKEYRFYINFKVNKGMFGVTEEKPFKFLICEEFTSITKTELLSLFVLEINKLEPTELRTALLELFFEDWKKGEHRID